MDIEKQFSDLLQSVESLKADSVNEIRKLRVENEKLKEQLKVFSGGRKQKRMTTANAGFAEWAQADFVRMAKNTDALHGMDNVEVADGEDGMVLTDSVAFDPEKSSYASGYDYKYLSAKEVLITLHDVGDNNVNIDAGPGMWANYILSKERNSTLKCVDKAKLLKEGKYYHVKSIREGLDIDTLVAYCKERNIKAICPTSVSDEIYLATHNKVLRGQGIYPFCCEDPQSYKTLDHKWLSYLFCEENGIPQAKTLPLRVDTVDACRELVAETCAAGKPVFVKECFDTCAGDGVIKVDKIEEYDDAVERITKGRGPQPADTSGIDQHIIVQAGHPGRIACCHNVFYKGNLVSLYITKENMKIMDKLGELRWDMTIGTWSTKTDDLSTSLKLELDDPCDRLIRDQAITIMKKVGKALNYTGMCEVEFICEHSPDAILNVLEFNPRFSGACHSFVGAGMVQDYMHVIGLMVNTNDDTDKVIAEKAGTFHARSDTHLPKSNFRDYNTLKFYMPQLATIAKLGKI
ncbi:unnamed protein product [Pseudo-nitzschia multistriata]|uniref:ATP-grasp domain-containing protein n=1 Tax=Pseudo-nitzschia multistriata TaxID=183589 RepID=A0A448ZS40_9STRA|nr:unnamed protein product [Pseudo-nitzschia multistriata]